MLVTRGRWDCFVTGVDGVRRSHQTVLVCPVPKASVGEGQPVLAGQEIVGKGFDEIDSQETCVDRFNEESQRWPELHAVRLCRMSTGTVIDDRDAAGGQR